MNLMDSLKRALDRFKIYSKDEIENYGNDGERIARQNFAYKNGTGIAYYNRLVPDYSKKNKYFEIDAIIYAAGNVFCVEIKRYKGKISYVPKYKMVKEKKKILWFEFEREKKVVDGLDKSRIIKEKVGNYNEDTFYKEFTNPIKKTIFFIKRMKEFLSGYDKRFKSLFIIPVVCFVDDEADISDIHSFEEGLIYVSELQQFINMHKNDNFDKMSSEWIIDGLNKLPTWDKIITSSKEELNGVLENDEVVFEARDKSKIYLKYRDIKRMTFKNIGLIFSPYSEVTVYKKDNSTSVYEVVSGDIVFNRFGERQIHKIVNISAIMVGTK